MDSWKNPDLLRRVVEPNDAREYIKTFNWEAHGFPEGKPVAFLAFGRHYYTDCKTDEDAVCVALALILDFETDAAMQERMFEEYLI